MSKLAVRTAKGRPDRLQTGASCRASSYLSSSCTGALSPHGGGELGKAERSARSGGVAEEQACHAFRNTASNMVFHFGQSVGFVTLLTLPLDTWTCCRRQRHAHVRVQAWRLVDVFRKEIRRGRRQLY